MAFYNEGGSNTRRKEVGENCTLELPGVGQTPVTNVSFTEEANTSEVQYNDSFAQTIAVTGVTYSGSFEIPGNANLERDVGWSEGTGDGVTSLPQFVDNMSITDGEGRVYSFRAVLFNSHNKDIPSDDRTTQSFDFMAEEVTVQE